jgi:hypothetical protein
MRRIVPRDDAVSNYFTVTEDPQAYPLLTVAPLALSGVKGAIAADMARTGHGTHCGECGKPFTPARKRRGVGRVRHLDAAGRLYSTTWVFCGRCHAAMQRNGGKVSEKLVEEAREATKAGQLAVMPTQGGMQ